MKILHVDGKLNPALSRRGMTAGTRRRPPRPFPSVRAVAVVLCSAGRGEAMREPVERRLAAILAADVAGYSRLMGADEEGTLERLKAHRRQLVDPKIKEHRGRIVKTTGDGLLVEFPSVVDAVRCAAEIQRAMVDRNPETPEDKRMSFRIG